MATKARTKKKAEHCRHPTIEVKDFGPIAQGKVELRPLTVFAGPSNTGKTWLATLVYSMFQHSLGPWNTFDNLGKFWDAKEKKLLFPENPAALGESLEKGTPYQFTPGEMHFVKNIIESRSDELVKTLSRNFGLTSHSYLARENESCKSVVNFTLTLGGILGQHKSKLTLGNSISYSANLVDNLFYPGIENNPVSEVSQGVLGFLNLADMLSDGNAKEGSRAAFFFQNMLGMLDSLSDSSSSVWYLPADRGGVMSSHLVIVSSLIQNASNVENPGRQARLSGVFADMLNNLVHLGRLSEDELNKNNEHASSIENKVIGGKVIIESNPMNYPQFFWQPSGWKRALPMLNVSSMVTELAPVALYLRYYVKPGDLLIIDEPEAHLHPSRQVDFINEIGGWVRSGIRVLLTTHSDWVLEALANLVAEGELADYYEQNKVAEKKAGERVGLRKEDVGFWLFQHRKRGGGAKIQEVPWDSDEGGYEADFFETAANLHNRWADIVERME